MDERIGSRWANLSLPPPVTSQLGFLYNIHLGGLVPVLETWEIFYLFWVTCFMYQGQFLHFQTDFKNLKYV